MLSRDLQWILKIRDYCLSFQDTNAPQNIEKMSELPLAAHSSS